jgi:hypothetical protein
MEMEFVIKENVNAKKDSLVLLAKIETVKAPV